MDGYLAASAKRFKGNPQITHKLSPKVLFVAKISALLALLGTSFLSSRCNFNPGTPYSGPKEPHQTVLIFTESDSRLTDTLSGVNQWNVLGFDFAVAATAEQADIIYKFKTGKTCVADNPNLDVVLGSTHSQLPQWIIEICPDAFGDFSGSSVADVVAHETGHVLTFIGAHLPESCEGPDPVDPSGTDALLTAGICGQGQMNPQGDWTNFSPFLTEADGKASNFLFQNKKLMYDIDSKVQLKGDKCTADAVAAGPGGLKVSGKFQVFPGDYQPGSTNPNLVLTANTDQKYIQYTYDGTAIVVKPSGLDNPESATVNIKGLPAGAQCKTAWCGIAPNGTLERCLDNCTGDTIKPDESGSCILTKDFLGNAIVVAFNQATPTYPNQVCPVNAVNTSPMTIELQGFMQYAFGGNPVSPIGHFGPGTISFSPGWLVVQKRLDEPVFVQGFPAGIECRRAVCDPWADSLESCRNQCSGELLETTPFTTPEGTIAYRCELPLNSPIGSAIHLAYKTP